MFCFVIFIFYKYDLIIFNRVRNEEEIYFYFGFVK